MRAIDVWTLFLANEAAEIVVDAVCEAGVDPLKAYTSPMVKALVIEWRDGRLTRAQFIHCMENVAVLNPGICAKR